jgi:hypothetical protein
MVKQATDSEFARAFAPLLEIQLKDGRFRAATPNDVLELIDPTRHYVLKGDGGYLAKHGKGWTRIQREAIKIPDRAFAHQARRQGLRENGVTTKVVRLRRRGTCGMQAVRLRPGLDVTDKDGFLSFGIGASEAMEMLATLTGAKVGGGEEH